MQYQAKLIASNGAVAILDFEADNNALASHHLAHLSRHKEMVETLSEWDSKPELKEGYTIRRYFRRHYATKWIQSV